MGRGAYRDRLPTALLDTSGATRWRRLPQWHEAGVWRRSCERLLAELRAAGLPDLSAALVDSAPPAPPDHRRHRHPLAVTLTGGNRNDVTQLIQLIDAVSPIQGVVGQARTPRR
ncbi:MULTISPECIES: hypothetical protein [Actinosynnema]|uniref:hypothetical protein n=1 Tax=Actinosynnema TaxID=40566 RepID=UPI0020A54583|nr:hypothetical protein [Actinosynnema pretiosum]MCP2099743.1 hypothetical protein [Actinosynnema pretiosum]